jgi:heme/copper-type cytochrome/quinol oxidase subunit 2
MPIAVRVVSETDFNKWLDDAKKKYAADNGDNAPPDSVAAASTPAVR